MPDQDYNLFSHFQKQFHAHVNRELLCTERNDSYTYADIDRASARMASTLSDAGVNAGDRISAQVEKSPQALCLYLACLRGGFVFHPLNPAFQASEVEYFVNDAEPAAIVCDSAKESIMQELATAAGVQRLYTLDGDGLGSLVEQSESASEDFPTVAKEKDDLAALLYSSGTTGVPKGIMLTHGNLL